MAIDTEIIVRIHTELTKHPWAKVWYLFRALDKGNKGWFEGSFTEVRKALRCASSTLYQYLRQAKRFGAIYHYKRKGDRLLVRLAGLHHCCQTLGLNDWDATAEVTLEELLSDGCKELGTAIATQRLQDQSRNAASRSLNKQERESGIYKFPDLTEIMLAQKEQPVSHKPTNGTNKIHFVLHCGQKRIFVSTGFVPYGASQKTIAKELGFSERTIRRHLNKLNVKSRQIVQSKTAYGLIVAGLSLDKEYSRYSREPGIYCIERANGETKLFEPNGTTSSRREDGHTIHRERFFKYRGKVWMYRCNLYAIDYSLKSMRVSKLLYKKLISGNPINLPNLDKQNLSLRTSCGGKGESDLNMLSARGEK